MTALEETQLFLTSETSTKSSPGGCLIALLGILPAAFGSIGLWGVVKWLGLAEGEGDQSDLRTMIIVAALGWAGAVVLFIVGYKVFRKTNFDNYDPSDPDQPKIKW